MIIWGEGAIRLSAGGFREAIDRALEELREEYLSEERRGINRLEF
jgi:hypothetical protein